MTLTKHCINRSNSCFLGLPHENIHISCMHVMYDGQIHKSARVSYLMCVFILKQHAGCGLQKRIRVCQNYTILSFKTDEEKHLQKLKIPDCHFGII